MKEIELTNLKKIVERKGDCVGIKCTKCMFDREPPRYCAYEDLSNTRKLLKSILEGKRTYENNKH